VNVLALLIPALQGGGDDGGIGIVGGLVQLVVIVYMIACLWMIFQKAGEEGWKAIIPIWNTIVLLKISGRPWWWLLLLLVPLLNIVILVIVYLDLGKSFGKGPVFSILGLFCCSPIGLGILAFGSDRYLGPGGPPAGGFQGGYQGGPNYQ
jgi:hypothetical protein